MTRPRQNLTVYLIALVAFVGATTSIRPAHADDQHPIVRRALQDLETYQGECWPWVKTVVFDATGLTLGFDYRNGFFEAGAYEVSPEEAAPGDIIQVALDSWTSPDADYPGLHTAIIVANNGDGTFDAIDSNQRWDGIVRLRPGYDPFAQAAAYGLQVHFYRLPFVTSAPRPGAPSGEPGAFAPGELVRTNTPGDCLRLRSNPGGEILRCLADGTQAIVIEGPVKALGTEWYRLSTPVGDGWMAGQYLVKVSSPSAAPSAQGPTRPIYRFRAIVPLASAD